MLLLWLAGMRCEWLGRSEAMNASRGIGWTLGG
jgi:hypothetical protein